MEFRKGITISVCDFIGDLQTIVEPMNLKSISNQYVRRWLKSVAVLVVVCAPLLLTSRPSDFMRAPWFFIAMVGDNFQSVRELDLGRWSAVGAVCVLLMLAVTARWKIASLLMTIWFVLNVLATYSFLAVYHGHS